MQTIKLVAAIAVIGSAVGWLAFQAYSHQESTTTLSSSEAVPPIGATSPITTHSPTAATTAPAQTAASAANRPTAAVPLWRVASTDTAPKPMQRLPKAVTQYQAIELTPEALQAPEVGDTLQLPLLNGQSVEVVVAHSELLPNGDLSWSGHLESQGTSYPVVMTHGKTSAFATITTEQGSYSLESMRGSGWLYKNPAEYELSYPEAPDHLEPPIGKIQTEHPH